MNTTEELVFADSLCRIGLPMNGALEVTRDPATLLAEMDRVGVEFAVVAHVNSAGAGSLCCNRQIGEWLGDGNERLVGCWSLLPTCTQETANGEAWFAAMRANRIAAVEILPRSHYWVADPWAVGDQFAELAARRVPIYVRLWEVGGWEGVYRLLHHFPANRFILSELGVWGCDRFLRPLLLNCPECYVEVSEYWVAEGLAALVRACGARQLLFGSQYPKWNHGQQMLNIRHALISDEERRAIAGGNLRRLLKEVRI